MISTGYDWDVLVPLVICDISIENDHKHSGCSWIFPLNVVIFRSYVKLPEGRIMSSQIFEAKVMMNVC